MTLSELKEKITEKTNQLKSNHQELMRLRSQYNQLEMEEFINYLQIGDVIEFDKYYSFKSYCKDPKATKSFYGGEGIKIVKKNEKSIVIEVVKKIKRDWSESQRRYVASGHYNPGWIMRIDLNTFFHLYMSNEKMKDNFDSYIKRKHNLQSLLDE